ncbi:hypothetical protein MMIC_P0219 [Mariprofundus micogutta]|uniref:DUF992 domain-containing protein n=1 Tax=Mariprofundus micogutta TaxID=1921010 RepID=A0A1L8CK49_9PROT|nr:DUF992 domain-containing protein [Mariprofundus micogutta]GAV19286.1 hypothetical protein MMIC_P0219 [Mariprofundus micogutta]
MNRFITAVCFSLLMLPAYTTIAAGNDAPMQKVGVLRCNILPHTGINLLIHSTRDIRCEFTATPDEPVEYYKGETGIGFGLDIAVGKGSEIAYAVLARQFKPHSNQLAGKYSGARGSAALIISGGDTAPIGKDDGTISLQPTTVNNKGSGVTLGFSYIYLEADSR